MAKKKRKRLIDQVYNGAFENAEFSPGSKNAILTAAGIILAGIVGSIIITQQNK